MFFEYIHLPFGEESFDSTPKGVTPIYSTHFDIQKMGKIKRVNL